MKYMGSKRAMLLNGLGETLHRETKGAKRFGDLFAGAGSVACYVAENFACSVIASDLQLFSSVLCDAIIGRVGALDSELVWTDWVSRARANVSESPIYKRAELFDQVSWKRARRRSVAEAREICSEGEGPITRSYGGHYFSPSQALAIDALRATVPTEGATKSVVLAALISAASRCAAAPGHTAQPFQPTPGAARFLFEGWRRDVWEQTKSALDSICPRHAQRIGEAKVAGAESLAEELGPGDIAFLDPPYSGVHYSRFYHVLETVARGECSEVSGVGRYPPPSERPKSDFSVSTKSEQALERLLKILGDRGVRTIFTFPREKTSNGLSGPIVEGVAEKYFRVEKAITNGRFSTLGGNTPKRKARIPAYEIILTLTPRNSA
jgi:adenine-specific DNA-methyltransferase